MQSGDGICLWGGARNRIHCMLPSFPFLERSLRKGLWLDCSLPISRAKVSGHSVFVEQVIQFARPAQHGLLQAVLSAWLWDDLIPYIDSSWFTLSKSCILLLGPFSGYGDRI